MSNDSQPPISSRDGTSQAGRMAPELDPGFAPLEERTTQDLLAFARAYGRELKYYDVADPDVPQGDWSGFIGPELDLALAAAFAREPERFTADASAPYTRPHFMLLLAVLELFGHARTQLNGLTRRHLEFFYRDVLRMIRKPAVPDHVHVLAELDEGSDSVRLPAGTALFAGQDRLGQDLVYLTDEPLAASRAAVADVRTLHAEIRVTGLKEASRQFLKGGTRNDAFLAMMQIALDPMTPELTFDILLKAQALLNVVPAALGMPQFEDFRALVRLKQRRQAEEAADWKTINTLLEKAGKKRDAGFRFAPSDPTDFLTNLRTALGKTVEQYARLYDGLQEVKSIEEAYAVHTRRADVAAFIQAQLFLSLDDFAVLMETRLRMEDQWSEIDRLLEEAGRRLRADATFRLPDKVRASHDFDAKLAAAVNAPNYTVAGGLDGYYRAFLATERDFFMPAEHLHYIMAVATRSGDLRDSQWDWDNVYDIVGTAHREKVYARRRDALMAVAQPYLAAADPVGALAAMLVLVFGTKPPEEGQAPRFVEDLLLRLDTIGVAAADAAYLSSVANKSEAAPDWPRMSYVLEVAQRNRERFADPVARRVEWRNLYPEADPRAAAAATAPADAEAQHRWKTFGIGERVRAAAPIPEPVFGWAVGSPLLALSEGRRTIDLTLGFAADVERFSSEQMRKLLAPPDGAGRVATVNPFVIELSTAKGWVQPSSAVISWTSPAMTGYPKVQGIDTSKLAALTFSLILDESQPALEPPVRDLHGLTSAEPVVRLMLKPLWNAPASAYVTSYESLRRLLVLRAQLSVGVAGLKTLAIRNDQTVLDAKKPFEPFGTTPSAGSRFYVGHRELVGKRLDALTAHMTWMGLPAALATHYANYPAQPANGAYSVKVVLVDDGILRPFAAPLGLFDPADAGKPVDRALALPADQGTPARAVTAADDVAEWNRHLVMELNAPDFQHGAYPVVALQKSMELAAAIANATPRPLVPATYQVNPPVVPKLKTITFDYAASAEVAFEPAATGAAVRIFHVEPFGYAELRSEGVVPGHALLPQYDFEGELYIGLREVSAPQRVSLLFQVAEGSANPDAAPNPVQWSYLSGNQWRTLQDGSLIADGTRGLINSGIVELSLKPAAPSTVLPDGLYWIRAAIASGADSVCDMVDVHANAVRATFDDHGNAPDHLAAPLPPASITTPVTPLAGIAAIQQPYTSFGGKMAEEDARFYVRVSERLRHKQRALTPWDYERLVLEKFPRLYKVKCLRADPVAHPRSPGMVELIVIPDIRNRLPFDPFEPKAPADVIRDIQAFLADKTPPFARVTVKNAHYVPVKVRCGVRFVDGSDEAAARRQLTEELNRFLSPWAYDEGADVVIGGKVYANSIIDFIEQRDYVDYIAEFKLFTSEDGGATFPFVPQTDDYHAATRGEDGVLVAAREHQFDVIAHADYRVEAFGGIDYMQIGLDFIVA
jgi:hypothetical protein